MKALKFARNPYTSLVINFAYAIDNCMIGFLAHSWWFITVGAYYTVLAATRFSVLQIKRKAMVQNFLQSGLQEFYWLCYLSA